MESAPRARKLQIAASLFVLAVIIIVGAIVSQPKKAKTTTSTTTATTKDTSSNTSGSCSATSATTAYKDGSYQSTGSYDSPAGPETIDVSLTLASNVVSNATVVSKANDPTASSYQEDFISGFKSQVVGKKISDIKLSNVSGSSLTSGGFNDALKKIACQAQPA